VDDLPDLSRRDEQQPAGPSIITPPEQFPGHWANLASIARTPHEFTLDFLRVGPGGQQAMLVTRVNCSPLLFGQLLEAMQGQWDAYQESSVE
jgi:hypothetical protein